MAQVAERTETLGDQPAVLAQRRGRRPAGPLPARRADELRRLAGVPARAPAAWRPTCPASGAPASAATCDFTMPGYDRFVEAFLDHVGARARAARRARLGRGRAAVGPALPRARRAPRGDRRGPAAAGLPLAPRRPLVAHAGHRRGRHRLRDPPRGPARDPRGGGRAGVAALRPGHAARDPAPVPREPRGRAGPRGPGPRRDRLPRARRVGRSRPVHARRASPTPTPPRSAARPRSCTCPTPATGRGWSARMSSTRSPRSWTRLSHAPAWPLAAVAAGLLADRPARDRRHDRPALPGVARPRRLGQRLVRRPSHAGLQRRLPAAGLDRRAARGGRAERGGGGVVLRAPGRRPAGRARGRARGSRWRR